MSKISADLINQLQEISVKNVHEYMTVKYYCQIEK